jgi:hypothetical protein
VLARIRPHLPALAGALLGAAALAWVSLYGFAWSDYDTEASAAFNALAGGHVGEFLRLSPSYGGSMVLRAPFAALAGILGGGEWAVYRAVSIPCVLVAGGLGVWLVAQMRAAGQPLLSRAAALGLCVSGPITMKALEIGHPEEIMTGVLCVGAVLAASGRRITWAGVFLGLAVATKAWALVAIGPVLVALPARQWRALLVAGAIAGAVLAPLAVAHPANFATNTGSMASTGVVFQPWQAWWFTGRHAGIVRGGDGHAKPGYRTPPAWIAPVTHPLIVLLSLALSGLLWLLRGRRRVARLDALLLLALLLHLRCVLDTWNFVYYAVPLLLALVTWEGLASRRPPVLSLSATVALWVLFQELPRRGVSADALSLAYLAWAVPAAVGLAVRLYAPRAWAALRRTSVRSESPRLALQS